MFKFTRTGVAYFVAAIIFVLIQIFISRYTIETEVNEDMMQYTSNYLKEENTSEIENVEEAIPEAKTEEELLEVKNQKDMSSKTDGKTEIWQIEIPKISLIANIAEGTTKEILNKYVGHFENTQEETGNVGLAAHNRGYEVNYFQNLKLLEEGDEIKYIHNEFEKIYEVEKCRIIKDTDWEYLENTEENMLTLITCVENEPEYRRCIQAVEKETNEDNEI